MSTAMITLIGLYEYTDRNLFENLILPEGIDKDTFIHNLLLYAGEFEPLYPDDDFLKFAIGKWGEKWYDTFERWHKSLSYEYNPFWNYDLTKESTDNRVVNNTTDTNTTTDTKNNSEKENYKSAYDSNTLQPNEKDDTDFTGNVKSNGNIKGNTKDDLTHKSHTYGIRPTMRSHSMSEILKEELEVSEWNLYQHMIDIFSTELLIMIY